MLQAAKDVKRICKLPHVVYSDFKLGVVGVWRKSVQKTIIPKLWVSQYCITSKSDLYIDTIQGCVFGEDMAECIG